MKEINGFIHVCMINDWHEIMREQASWIIESGLYSNCKTIYIGAVGPAKGLEIIKALHEVYPKFQLADHSPDVTKFEFLTLKHLKAVCDLKNPFYGFYIHSKGVSWPKHEGGKYWRDYMNYFILVRWRDCLWHLDKGYDTCGVKIVNRGFPLHYSGNFWWFKSDYIQRLPDIQRLNQRDRFQAEMWIGMAQPICATLSQEFVDYNTKGVFKPSQDEDIYPSLRNLS